MINPEISQPENEPQIQIPEELRLQAINQIIPSFSELEAANDILNKADHASRAGQDSSLNEPSEKGDIEHLRAYYDIDNWLLSQEERILLGSLANVDQSGKATLETANAVLDAYRYSINDSEMPDYSRLNERARSLLSIDADIRNKLADKDLNTDPEIRKNHTQETAEEIFAKEYELKLKELNQRLLLDRPYLKNLSEQQKKQVIDRALPEMQRQARAAANYEKNQYLGEQKDTERNTSIDSKKQSLILQSDKTYPSRTALLMQEWDNKPDGIALMRAEDELKSFAKLGIHNVSDVSQLTEKQIDYLLNTYTSSTDSSTGSKNVAGKIEAFREKQRNSKFARTSNHAKRQKESKSRALKTLHAEFDRYDERQARLSEAFEKFTSERNDRLMTLRNLRLDRDVTALNNIAEKILSHASKQEIANDTQSAKLENNKETISSNQSSNEEKEIARRIALETQHSDEDPTTIEKRVRDAYVTERAAERANQARIDADNAQLEKLRTYIND